MMVGVPVPFSVAVSDETGGHVKIQRKDFLTEGLLPVIDQGQEDIAGYTNDLSHAYTGGMPAILFGDHTRAFKYVDKPFAIGADGVKILAPKPGFNAKFLYYFFLSREIPSRGYSRHFKFLKELAIPLFALSEQYRIVEILDEAYRLRRLCREADAKVARILPALFLKIFGDPVTNSMKWPVASFADTFADTTAGNVKLQSSQFLDSGKIAVVDQGQSQIAGYFDDASIAYRGRLPVIVFGDHTRIFKFIDHPFVLGADGVRVLMPKATVNPFFAYWHCKLLSIPSAGYSRHFKYLKEKSFMCPDTDMQNNFDAIAISLSSELLTLELAAKKVEHIFTVLLEKAFSGELTERWRESHMLELLAEMAEQVRALDLLMPKKLEVSA